MQRMWRHSCITGGGTNLYNFLKDSLTILINFKTDYLMRGWPTLQGKYSLSISALTRNLVPSTIAIFELRQEASFWVNVICAKFTETVTTGK